MMNSRMAQRRLSLACACFIRDKSIAVASRYMTFFLALFPMASLGCACGCGVFDVGTAAMFPQHSGAMAYVEYDYMDQNKNWSSTSRAPTQDNDDRRIGTSFLNVGLQYQLDRRWGLSVEVPYWQRLFKSLDSDTGDIMNVSHGAVGDIRIKGRYTGFSEDMSTGLTFGLKLPTGDTHFSGFDPDTSIGSGSTDFLLGAYHQGNLSQDHDWRYFVQAQLQEVVSNRAIYRPGSEIVTTTGVYYEGWQLSPNAKIAPVLQLNATYRGHDGGLEGRPQDSGYTRLMVAPGMQMDVGRVSMFIDVGLPMRTNVSGDQLVSSHFWRVNLSYHFKG